MALPEDFQIQLKNTLQDFVNLEYEQRFQN